MHCSTCLNIEGLACPGQPAASGQSAVKSVEPCHAGFSEAAAAACSSSSSSPSDSDAETEDVIETGGGQEDSVRRVGIGDENQDAVVDNPSEPVPVDPEVAATIPAPVSGFDVPMATSGVEPTSATLAVLNTSSSSSSRPKPQKRPNTGPEQNLESVVRPPPPPPPHQHERGRRDPDRVPKRRGPEPVERPAGTSGSASLFNLSTVWVGDVPFIERTDQKVGLGWVGYNRDF